MAQDERENLINEEETAEPIVKWLSEEDHKRCEGREKKQRLSIFKRLLPKSIGHLSMTRDERRQNPLSGHEKAEPLLEVIAEAKQSWCHSWKNSQSLIWKYLKFPVQEDRKEQSNNGREMLQNPCTVIVVAAAAVAGPGAAAVAAAAKCDLILQGTHAEAASQPVLIEKMIKDDWPRKKKSKEKHKVTKQTNGMDDISITTQTFGSYSEYDTDSGSLLHMQCMSNSHNILLELKEIHCQQLRGHSRIMETEINALRKEIAEGEKLNSKIRKKNMKLDREWKLRMVLKREIEKLRTAEHLCKITEKQLHKIEKQNNKLVAENEQQEKELENRRNEVKQVLKQQNDNQKQVFQEETQGHHYCNLENIKLRLQKLISEVQEIKVQYHEQKKHQTSILKSIVNIQAETIEELKKYVENVSQKLAQDANWTAEYDGEKFEQQCLELLTKRESLLQQIFNSSSENESQGEANRNFVMRVEQDASTLSDLHTMEYNRSFLPRKNRMSSSSSPGCSHDCMQNCPGTSDYSAKIDQELTKLLHSLD